MAALSVSKILDNMEIGHNVMHGQYDWMNDPQLNSKMYEWDNVSPSANWQYTHNYIHHTYTNIRGLDRDIGYGLLRIDPDQKWHPAYLGNPLYAVVLMFVFQWGVLVHDLELDRLQTGEATWAEVKERNSGTLRKVRRQLLKDYVLFPALTGPFFASTMAGNATANVARNVWAFAIIFCGHFPADVESFSEESAENESRGQWYLRQLLGSANITGSKLFHIMSGNLSYQIEHHLFPDIPSRALPRDRRRGPRAVREVRPAVQHRSAAQAAGQRRQEDCQVRTAQRVLGPPARRDARAGARGVRRTGPRGGLRSVGCGRAGQSAGRCAANDQQRAVTTTAAATWRHDGRHRRWRRSCDACRGSAPRSADRRHRIGRLGSDGGVPPA
ncbi:MAG: acyl-CoA desaturase [Nocardioidaceae bacterium]